VFFLPVGFCILVLLLGTIFIQSKRCPAQGSQSLRYDWFCDFSQGSSIVHPVFISLVFFRAAFPLSPLLSALVLIDFSVLTAFVFPLIILGGIALAFLATWSASLHALSQQLSYEDGPLSTMQRKL
jgi:hypothetical protein